MSSSANFVCFGEILWDVFRDKQHLGGAPLNVALRLASLCGKKSVQIISAVGQDTLGKAALIEVNNSNLLSDNIQTNEYPTGSVNVTLSEAGNASYSIAAQVAWDYIAETKGSLEALNEESVFVYGSLAARSAVSRETLMSLIKVANFTVFDVNLRTPFYDLDVVFELMKKASFIKMNNEELKLICRHRYGPSAGLEEQLQWLQITTSASSICVTLGAKGACLLHDRTFIEVSGIPTTVVDTVGAGDSFLATLLWALFDKSKTPKQALEYACAMGSLVAGRAGANPKILREQLEHAVTSN